MVNKQLKKSSKVDWDALKARLVREVGRGDDEKELTLLFRERARTLARSEEGNARAELEECLRFRAADVAFGISLVDVHTILASPSIARIPGAPQHLNHVAYADGKVVPILDPGPLMDRPALSSLELRQRRLLILGTNQSLLGIAVGSILEVIRIAPTQLSVPPPGSWSANVARGLTDELTTILDAELLWGNVTRRSADGANH